MLQSSQALHFLLFLIISGLNRVKGSCITNDSSVLSLNLTAIQIEAGGNIPDLDPPTNISSNGLTSLRLLNFIADFELALSGSLLASVTCHTTSQGNKTGSEVTALIKFLREVKAQQELYKYKLSTALGLFGQQPPRACCFQIPSESLHQTLEFAGAVAGLVTGALQDIIENFAREDEPVFVRFVASVLAAIGNQRAQFRGLSAEGLTRIGA